MLAKISSFKDDCIYIKYFNGKYRSNGIANYKHVCLTGRNSLYPNCLLKDINNDCLISPYDEKIMSLNKDSFYEDNLFEISAKIENSLNKLNIINDTVFFFIYNFDNYYHFLYDTLPYLCNYIHLKNIHPKLKLLVNYPNCNKKQFYKFNIDILEKFIDINNDLLIHDNNNLYDKMYVSTSLTHGGSSNLPPNKEIYKLYSLMKEKIIINPKYNDYKYIYISRRTWINNDSSNIGTNYTTRRKMMNEDNLVKELEKIGVKEIFTENLSIDEKIQVFNNAYLIIGSIGGGMANLLFSQSTTKSLVIVTPEFLEINLRFKYSMEHTNITYFNNVCTYKEENNISLYCRVKITANKKYKDMIGEIIEYDHGSNKYKINISKNDVAGFNNAVAFENEWFYVSEFDLLDNGLNSPYLVDIEKLISAANSLIDNTQEELYTVINKTKNITQLLSIQNIISFIHQNPTDDYCKIIDDHEIPINNEIVMKTHFICHRINSLNELQNIPTIFGTEIDIRDDFLTKTIHLSHDPFEKGTDLEDYLKLYKHGTLILNIKSERVELKCIELMKKYDITDYFFLDSNIPMIYLLNKEYDNSNIACRLSEFEPINSYDKIKHFIKWTWIDCFTSFPLSLEMFNLFKRDNKRVCIVSPELQNQHEKINTYRDYLIENRITPQAICCKHKNIIYWI